MLLLDGLNVKARLFVESPKWGIVPSVSAILGFP